MKKCPLALAFFALCFSLCLTGCHSVGDKSATLSVLYIGITVLSFLTLGAYCALIKQKDRWFLLLFSAVPTVNVGYCWLSLSQTLDSALWANRLSYLGSVLLPFAMLMIILNVANIPHKPWVPWALLAVSGGVFTVAASPGISDIYYQSVTLTTVNGSTVLEKVYGPWHPLYLVFLLAYFISMVVTIVYATSKKTVRTNAHAVLLAIAVFVNIGVWLIGQLLPLEFEFLSVSYLISELFLLGLQLLIQDGDKLFAVTAAPTAPPADEEARALAAALADFAAGLTTLTPTERTVYTYYTEGKSTKEVLELLHITENTLKYHNRNLYSKLGVSSRKQLKELARQLPADTK